MSMILKCYNAGNFFMKAVENMSIPVTILTVSFNAENTIARTIESVMNQSYKNIEYIVIDGASHDNTAAIAESYIERFTAQEGRKMTVISEPDKGMYDALNKGAKIAGGVIVGIVNADDYYESEAVETMAELYKREKYNVGWGTVRLITSKGSIIKHAKIPTWGGGHVDNYRLASHGTVYRERSIA